MAQSKPASIAQAPATTKLVKPPEGMRKFTGDVVGFHDCETQGPIYGIPRAAKLSDSALDETKPSAFVIFELLDNCDATEGSGDDATSVPAKKGDMVGVWLKAGMRGLKNLCGIPVFMQHSGEKKLKGKPAAFNAMKTFDFHVGQGKGTLIPVIEDNRKKSRDVPNFLVSEVKKREPGEDNDEFGF